MTAQISGLGLINDPEPAGSVYLIGPEQGTTAKIGRSTDIPTRLANIQRMSPVRLSVLWHHPGDHRLESALHSHFADRRSHGEWFDFGCEDPVKCVTRVMKSWFEPPPPPQPGLQGWGMLRQEGLYFAIPREYWFDDEGFRTDEQAARVIERSMRGSVGASGHA